MKRKLIVCILVIASLFLVTGCTEQTAEPETMPAETTPELTETMEETAEIIVETLSEEAMEEEAMKETMAEISKEDLEKGIELYTTITEKDDYKNWLLWPGKGKLYPGTEPHGSLLTIYVTADVRRIIEKNRGMMLPDSIIIKENYNSDKELMALTVMHKIKDYDPEHNDWFWAKYSPDGTVEAAGKVESCINCHEQRESVDYLFSATAIDT